MEFLTKAYKHQLADFKKKLTNKQKKRGNCIWHKLQSTNYVNEYMKASTWKFQKCEPIKLANPPA